LSATVARKDGHHPIIFMQCGPVRYRVDAKSQTATRSFSHKVRLRETGFQHRPNQEVQGPSLMTTLYAALAQDEKRNDLIFDVVLKARLRHDVMLSLQAGRRPVILTERRDHLEYFRARLEKFTRHLVVLYGGMNATERRAAEEGLKRPDTEERLVLATGRYLGEGFDDASLDTLFLIFLMKSWADLMEGHTRPVRRPTASRASRQARGHRLRLRRFRCSDAGAHGAEATVGLSRHWIRGDDQVTFRCVGS
jgi:superfamily II DNA or RNA helicase